MRTQRASLLGARTLRTGLLALLLGTRGCYQDEENSGKVEMAIRASAIRRVRASTVRPRHHFRGVVWRSASSNAGHGLNERKLDDAVVFVLNLM